MTASPRSEGSPSGGAPSACVSSPSVAQPVLPADQRRNIQVGVKVDDIQCNLDAIVTREALREHLESELESKSPHDICMEVLGPIDNFDKIVDEPSAGSQRSGQREERPGVRSTSSFERSGSCSEMRKGRYYYTPGYWLEVFQYNILRPRHPKQHGFWQRVQLSLAICPCSMFLFLIAGGRDLYILKFGASAKSTGFFLVVWSILSCMVDMSMGYIQDKSWFIGHFFDEAKWGRRAPWFMVSAIFGGVAGGCLFLPPVDLGSEHAEDLQGALLGWFAFCNVVLYFAMSAIRTAFDASVVELYAFADNRVRVEGITKFTYPIGVVVAMGATQILLMDARLHLRIIAFFVMIAFCLATLVATPLLKQTALCNIQETPPGKSKWQLFWSSLCKPVFGFTCFLRFLQGCWEGVLYTAPFYYLSLVMGYTAVERLVWTAACGLMAAVGEMALAPMWTRTFAKSTNSLFIVAASGQVLDACAAAILVPMENIAAFMAWFGICRLCVSPYSYWRNIASAWVVDEDGSNQEGFLLGTMTMVRDSCIHPFVFVKLILILKCLIYK